MDSAFAAAAFFAIFLAGIACAGWSAAARALGVLARGRS